MSLRPQGRTDLAHATSETALLPAVIRTIPDIAWLKDPAGVYRACNPAMERFLGIPETGVVGKTDRDFFPAVHADRCYLRDQQAAAAREPETHREWVLFPSTGRQTLMETTRTALRDSTGALIGVLGIARDVTSAQDPENTPPGRPALPAPLERIAATVPGVIFALRRRPDGSTCVPYASTALEDVWGFRPEELARDGSAAWATIHPADMAAVRAAFGESARCLSPWRGEFRIRHPHKGEVWLEGRSTPVREPDGGILWHGFLMEITDRKRMEGALRSSEADLREAERLASIGSWSWDLDSDRIEWSEALYRMAGRDPASPAPTYDDILQIYTPASRERSRRAVELARESGTPYELDLEVVLPDGRRGWRTVRGEGERDASGRVTRLHETVQDITDRKSAEEQMRAALTELAVIHAHAPVVLLLVDEDLRVEKVNETASRLAGRPEAELLGLRPGEAINCLNARANPLGCGYSPACGACVLRSTLLDTLQTGERHDDIEAWVSLVRGSEVERRCMLLFTAPLETKGRRRVLLSVLDITTRKEAEYALRVSETRFRTLTEDAPIAISMSRDGKIVYGNPMYVQMFGYRTAEELYCRQTIELFAPQCRDEVRERADRRLRGLPVPREFESIGQRADGSEFPMLVAVITMQFEEGPALVAFITDLTGPKKAEEERSRLEQQFRQAQKLEGIGRLAAGVAHDFNNLLTVINGYSCLLLDRLDTRDPLRHGIEEIRQAGERAIGLTSQLLAFSRKQVLKPMVLELNAVVSGIQPMLARLLGEDVELRIDLHTDATTIRADRHQLEQVLMNLAVNSRDAMPEGGKLSIRTAALTREECESRSLPGALDGGCVMLSVKDTGAGMDEETRGHAFEPFFTTKEVGRGTGLGLSTVQGIVMQSGGQIEVESEPNRGTTFRIYLPRVDEPAAAPGKPAATPAARGKATVLVVEDQAQVRKFTAAALSAYGYRVIQSESAADALLLCEREQENIDLVLTDLVMPNASGRQLAESLARRWPTIKVLFMSGHTDDAIARYRVLGGGADFIQKPFGPDELAAKVAGILGAPEQRHRILVVDDEPAVRTLLRAALEDAGYETAEAADGGKALDLARTGQVDLVITDLTIPGMEGIKTIRTLRSELPHIGIIAMSGTFGGGFPGAARRLGADAVLEKPLDLKLVLLQIAEVLLSHRQE